MKKISLLLGLAFFTNTAIIAAETNTVAAKKVAADNSAILVNAIIINLQLYFFGYSIYFQFFKFLKSVINKVLNFVLFDLKFKSNCYRFFNPSQLFTNFAYIFNWDL